VLARTLWVYERVLEINGRQMPWGLMFPLACKLWVSTSGEVCLRELSEYHRQMNLEYKKHSGRSHASWSNFNWDSVLASQPKIARTLCWPASVHESHKSKLISKDAGYYRRSFERLGLTVPASNLAYAWEGPEIASQTVGTAG